MFAKLLRTPFLYRTLLTASESNLKVIQITTEKYFLIRMEKKVKRLLNELTFIFRQKRKILFPEKRMTRKIFTRAAANLFFQINLIEFFK